MTDEEITALADHMTTLESDLAQARRRIQDLEAAVEECRAREAAHDAAVQDRIARLIEHQQRRRVEGEQVLRNSSDW